jgi:hypothetical protein
MNRTDAWMLAHQTPIPFGSKMRCAMRTSEEEEDQDFFDFFERFAIFFAAAGLDVAMYGLLASIMNLLVFCCAAIAGSAAAAFFLAASAVVANDAASSTARERATLRMCIPSLYDPPDFPVSIHDAQKGHD